MTKLINGGQPPAEYRANAKPKTFLLSARPEDTECPNESPQTNTSGSFEFTSLAPQISGKVKASGSTKKHLATTSSVSTSPSKPAGLLLTKRNIMPLSIYVKVPTEANISIAAMST